MDDIIGGIIIAIIIIFVIFLVTREFWCWYMKQNKIVALLESIDRKLGSYNLDLNSNVIVEASKQKSNIINKDEKDINIKSLEKVDYKEMVSELSKIYNLYKKDVYSEEEYINRKSNWIEGLKLSNHEYDETEFLNELYSANNDKILDLKEMESIKYIVSGNYARDEYKREQEEKRRLEEERKRKVQEEEDEARRRREEIFNNIRGKTKEVAHKTLDKINDAVKSKPIETNNISVCECGEKIKDDFVFCRGCGKKLR